MFGEGRRAGRGKVWEESHLQGPQGEKAVWLEVLADRARPCRLRKKEMSCLLPGKENRKSHTEREGAGLQGY